MVNSADETEREIKVSIKRLKTLNANAIGWSALTVALLFTIMAFSPLTSAHGIDLVVKDTSLNNAKITNILKLDASDILKRASNGETIVLLADGAQISFRLIEGSFLSRDYRIVSPDGVSFGRSDGITLPKFFSGEDIIGATSVSATIAGAWMQFTITVDNKTYTIDAYDGTGSSGYYAVVNSGPSQVGVALLVPDDNIIQGDVISLDTSNTPAHRDVNYTVPTNITYGFNSIVPESSNTSIVTSASENHYILTDTTPSTIYPNEHSSALVNIYLVADSDYINWCNVRGYNYNARMSSELWNVHGHYESQAGVSFQIAGAIGLSSGLCTSTNAYILWTQFMSYMANSTGLNTWEVAHLFSGKTLSGGNYYARESGAGMSKFFGDPAYKGYGASISQQTYTGSNENDWLLGHCIGVSLNGDPNYAGSTSDWMYPTWSPSSTFTLNTNDVNRIQSFAQQVVKHQKSINFGPSQSTWNNLYVVNMVMLGSNMPKVGAEVTFGFIIYNTASSPITLERLCVGGRDADGNVKDFGNKYNVVIPAKVGTSNGVYEYWYTTSTGFDSAGTWTLFASAYYNGQYSPYEWLAMHPTVYLTLKEQQGAYYSSTNGKVELFYQWGLYSTTTTPGIGETVLADFSLFNMNNGVGSTTYNNLFVGCRNTSSGAYNKDFGWVNNVVLTNKGAGVVGGGYHISAPRTVDSVGTWTFWPAYQQSSGWGPYKWQAQTIDVGFVILPWSLKGTDIAKDTGTSVGIMLPTRDGDGAWFSIGYQVTNFYTKSTWLQCPDVEIKICTMYEDMNPYKDDSYLVNRNRNGIQDVRINIEKVIWSAPSGTILGSSASLDSSAALIKLASLSQPYAGGTYLYYPSQLRSSTNPIGDVALDCLGMMPGPVGMIVSVATLVYDMKQMLSAQPDGRDTRDQTLTDRNAAWAFWEANDYNTNLWPGPDNGATFNWVDLQCTNTEISYCYRVSATVKYAYATDYNWDIGYYVVDYNTVTTPYIYLAVG